MSEHVHLGILEDDADMRGYLSTILSQHDHMVVSFATPTVKAAEAAMAQNGLIDLYLVDLELPDGNGADFIRRHVKETDSKALVLTVLGDSLSVMTALQAGADGYLLKDTPPSQIVRHIDETIRGDNPISSQAASHLLKHFHEQKTAPRHQGTQSLLTPREAEILTLFAKGLSYREAAEALGLSPYTINDYVKSIYGKLSVHSRNEAVFEALQLGLISI